MIDDIPTGAVATPTPRQRLRTETMATTSGSFAAAESVAGASGAAVVRDACILHYAPSASPIAIVEAPAAASLVVRPLPHWGRLATHCHSYSYDSPHCNISPLTVIADDMPDLRPIPSSPGTCHPWSRTNKLLRAASNLQPRSSSTLPTYTQNIRHDFLTTFDRQPIVAVRDYLSLFHDCSRHSDNSLLSISLSRLLYKHSWEPLQILLRHD